MPPGSWPSAGLDPDDTVLGRVMTPNPDTVAPNNTALEALRRMTECGYRHLPVVDGEQIVGIVSIRDLYAAVNRELAEDLQQREAFMFDTGYGTG
jgi:CBS domain-containing protein